jgi:hypothetical protein
LIGLTASNTTGGTCAPIQLPHGAEILELKAGVYDGDSNDVVAHLYRVHNTATFALVAAGATSLFSGGYTTVSDTTIAAGTEIVDRDYAYLVIVTGVAPGNFVVNVMVHYRLVPNAIGWRPKAATALFTPPIRGGRRRLVPPHQGEVAPPSAVVTEGVSTLNAINAVASGVETLLPRLLRSRVLLPEGGE